MLPNLSNSHPDCLRVGLADGFGDHALIIEGKIAAAPQAYTQARSEPERVGGVGLPDAIHASLAADVVIGIADTHSAGVRLRLA